MGTAWESIPYHELKRICAMRGISGKGKKEELVERLHAADAAESASNGPAAARSEPSADQAAKVPLPPQADAATKRTAGRTRKSAAPAKLGDGLASAAAQVVESVKGAAAAGVEKAKEAADVAKAHLLPLPSEEEATPAPATQGRRQRRERLEVVPVIPWVTFLMLALLGMAFGFAFLLVAHPQAPALRATSWKLADAVVADTKARGHYAVVKTQAVTGRGWDYMIARMERACLSVYHGMVYLGNTFQEAFPRGRSACRRTLQAAVLEHLIPPDAPAAAHQLVSLWPPPDGSPASRKGTGLLLGCATPAVCDRLFRPFERQVEGGPCAGCVLHITDRQLAGVESEEVAGLLQKKLARFLRRCPDGIVLIDAGAIVPRETAVMPLITALSEQSVFQYNGRDIPVGSALLIMAMRTDIPGMEPISGTVDEDKAASAVKGRLVAWLVGSGRPRGEDPKVVNALALRRRFDVVAYWKQ